MKNKLDRYEYNKKSNFIIQEGKDLFKKTKGNWSNIFHNKNPLYLELACGNGEYTVSRSIENKNNNYIGIDIKGSRLWKGAKLLELNNCKNALFLRIPIEQITDFFSENEVNEILISFPDPRPKKRDFKKRLTNENFLLLYYNILKDGGKVLLKTDDPHLFYYSIDQIKTSKFKILDYTNDLYNSSKFESHKMIQTKYEKRFLKEGKNIHFLECLK